MDSTLSPTRAQRTWTWPRGLLAQGAPPVSGVASHPGRSQQAISFSGVDHARQSLMPGQQLAQTRPCSFGRESLITQRVRFNPDQSVQPSANCFNHGCASPRLKIPLACLMAKAQTRTLGTLAGILSATATLSAPARTTVYPYSV